MKRILGLDLGTNKINCAEDIEDESKINLQLKQKWQLPEAVT
ncbi:hypothetical protein [Epilithonimonas sp.]|nr:hypothetical protein [Epilithonimonas sp.]